MSQNLDSLAAACDLSSGDRERLTLYLDSGQDPRALADKAGITLIDAITWIASPPIRRALVSWDYANRRARALRDEADRRLAIDALKAVCHRLAPSRDSLHASSASTQQVGADPTCHRHAPSGDSLPSSTPSTQHAGADARFTSALSAPSADQSGVASAPPEFTRLIEVRRAATTILRALDPRMGAMATARRADGARPPRHRKPRRISDFTFSDPAEAERLLEKERRENDRLAALIKQATAVADSVLAPLHPPAFGGGVDAARSGGHAATAGAPSPTPSPRLEVHARSAFTPVAGPGWNARASPSARLASAAGRAAPLMNTS